MVDETPFYSADTLYVAWWVINNGSVPTTTNAPMAIYLDGQVVHRNIVYPLQPSQTANCCLCVSVGPLSAGTHTIKILVDTTNAVDESNEADNEYTKTITVINTETVSTPSTPSGPTSGTMGTSYSYTTGGSSSNLGHSIQYLFDWGDGTNSGWLSVGQTSASKSWASAGAYSVKTQARCAIDTSVVSSWSETLSVTITISAPETVSTPITPTGPTSGVTGTSYAYTTGGSTSSYGHSVEYQFDWKGDGTDLSSWGAATQSKTWATLGTYNVRARARCVTDSSVVSDWSEILSVTITFGGAATINLPQTGQTKCYASSGIEINCVGTGQDGELQMGVNWPNPRFTVSGDCVTDNLTGLMWSKNGNLANSEVTWQGTLDYVANIVNSGSGLCGYKDWRLPNINEFESLVNAGMSDSAYWLNSQGFINVLSSNCYWSSTASAYSTNEALVIFMGNGVIFGLPKYTGGRIWPVRLGQLNNPDSSYPANIWKTGQTTTYATGDDGDLERGVAWPSPRFTDNGNGTVTDKLTGLMWSKNANLAAGTKTWQEALDYVKTLSTGGYSDWRLPNRKELFSLIDHSKTTPALPADHPFQNLQGYYWSSTGEQESEIYAFAVYMTYGDMSGGNKSADYFYVWPVRGGTVLEYISNPTLPTGPNSGTTGTSYSYTTGGSTSSLGHPLEYQFDWKGDGTDLSPWGSATQSKAWAVAGNYSVRARARCTTDTDVISSWSGTLSVTITAPETVSAPTTPSGPTTGFIGTSCSYTTGGSTSSLGHTVQYYFDWGDATNSGWLPVGTTSASKSWSSAGMYSIKAQARCAIDTSIVSSWSGTLSVTITISVPETVSTPTTPSGPTSGVTGTSYAYTTGGSTSSYGHPVEYQFDWKGDGTDLSSWGSATLSKIWTTAGTYNVRARARCTLDTSVMSGWSGSVQVAIATSKSTRTLPPYYTPSLPLTVAIAINPGAVTQTYSAEDSPPNGWTVSNINENGQWDDVNKKVKWGVFFDNSPRTLTYEVTPPGGETGVKSFSGKASFDGVNEVIGGDSRIELGALFHPADTSLNFELSINEVAAYAAAWRAGQTWPVPPNPIPIEYPTNAGYLWRNGEVYYYDGTKIPPSCWVPGAGTGSLSVDRSPSLKNQTSLKSYVTLSTGTATRDLPNCYTPSVAVSISITVTPGQGTQVYAVEDSPPAGWTVSDINESGGWDNVKKKVKWGVFFDANNRTLTYKATPPVGETGAKTFSGTVSFDGNNVSIGGDQTIFSGITGFLFDYDGDGATDVAAFHLPTDQFFTDYAGNLGQFGWGESDSMPLIWDYDGDGKTDVSIYHIPTNQWFVQGVGNLGQFGWGGEESVPVPGDYNGDGRMERAFYHSPTNRWFVEGQDPVQFGWNGAECIPVPGDYDGDGKTDMVIYHIPSNQWFQYGVGNLGQFGWGGEDCIPVPGDYNGDGKTEIAVYHVPTNQWFVKGMGNLGQYGWGGLESFPIPGDYNGDGVMERGFYRPSENRWFIEGESDFVWGWGGSEFMPITSQIAVYNWFRFNLHKFE
jgi:hypothetical protein